MNTVPERWVHGNGSRLVQVSVDQPFPVASIQFGHFNSIGARIGPVDVPVERSVVTTQNQKNKTFQWLIHSSGELPSDPVQGNAIRVGDISQIQVDFFHWVAAKVIKRGHVGAFDGAKLRSSTQNGPVDDTCRMSREG